MKGSVGFARGILVVEEVVVVHCTIFAAGARTMHTTILSPFFRMKKVFTGQHFHRIAFDSRRCSSRKHDPNCLHDEKKSEMAFFPGISIFS